MRVFDRNKAVTQHVLQNHKCMLRLGSVRVFCAVQCVCFWYVPLCPGALKFDLSTFLQHFFFEHLFNIYLTHIFIH